jgi:hypothetical protein
MQVRQTLQLAQELLVSSYGDDPLLQPAAARLANAVVAVLGPEFTLGSAAYQRCKSLVTPASNFLGSTASASPSPGAAAAAAGGPGSSAAVDQALAGDSSGGYLHDSGDLVRAVADTWSELERVLFAQQLVLFAPKAVPAQKHLPLLVGTLLRCSRPALRRAAAATLRHLVERDADAVLQVGCGGEGEGGGGVSPDSIVSC